MITHTGEPIGKITPEFIDITSNTDPHAHGKAVFDYVYECGAPDLSGFRALQEYAGSFREMHSSRNNDTPVIYSRTLPQGGSEHIGEERFASLTVVADPTFWMLSDDERTRHTKTLDATRHDELPGEARGRHTPLPANPQEAMHALMDAQSDAGARLALDHELRLEQTWANSRHALRISAELGSSALDKLRTQPLRERLTQVKTTRSEPARYPTSHITAPETAAVPVEQPGRLAKLGKRLISWAMRERPGRHRR